MLQSSVQSEDLDGWLFSSFKHRDPVSEDILSIAKDTVNTRRWFYIIRKDAPPLKIVHIIEPYILDSLPGESQRYCSEDQLFSIFLQFRGLHIAAHIDQHLPQFSTLDSGTYLFLQSCGIIVETASNVLQKTIGVLQTDQVQSHEYAAKCLYQITAAAWNVIKESNTKGTAITEQDLRSFVIDCYAKNGLISDHPPIIAFGEHTADPHYSDADHLHPLHKNEPVQFDFWATLPGGIYADISWFGVYADSPARPLQNEFAMLIKARNIAATYISESFQSRIAPTGAAVDEQVRNVLIQAGYESAIRHRTGHAIGTECHGCGVNLDSIEFPDYRKICSGSLFSVEPGLYFDYYGMRTEIDILIRDNQPYITGGFPIQQQILHL